MSNPRIISGSKGGLRLKGVPGNVTRPITDKVKEALFNILGPDIVGCRFLDLFGGTGSVGIESISRGADFVVFVEKNFAAFRTLKENLKLAQFEKQSEIRRMDAFKYLETFPEDPFDFIYVAPPQYKGMWKKACLLLDKNENWLFPGGDLILQIDFLEYEKLDLKYLVEYKQKRYGDTLLIFFQPKKEVTL